MNKEGLSIHGFSRVQIEEDDKIVGDSGWVGPNQITNLGFLYYLCHNLGKSAGSLQIAYMALGTGTAPAAAGVILPGEVSSSTKRKTVSYENVSSTTAQFTATFGSSDSFVAATADLQNVGLFNGTTAANTLFAGNTYASSNCNTNQNVNVTYQIRFSAT
jgi:hypothetical protein